jgi:DNA-binding response OmpR family regulator
VASGPGLVPEAERIAREYRDFTSVLRGLPTHPTITLHRGHRTVWTEGQRRSLTARQFDILALLVDLNGAIAHRDRLTAEIWRGDPPAGHSRTVDMHIARIREKLGLPEVILTVRGQGYRFNTAIGVVEEARQLVAAS